MSIGRSVKREVRVALSPRAQPLWFRLLKWVVIVTVCVRYLAPPVLLVVGGRRTGAGTDRPLHLALEDARLDTALGRVERRRGGPTGLSVGLSATSSVTGRAPYPRHPSDELDSADSEVDCPSM